MKIAIPQLSLVVLVGVSGAGKSTFAARHFAPFETVSSDFCRGLVSNDTNDQSATGAAFEVLHTIVAKRLAAGLLTVVDATNVQPAARAELVRLARDHDVLPVAIVLEVSESVAVQRNLSRPDRDFGRAVIARQGAQLRSGLRRMEREGFRAVHRVPVDEVERAEIVRERLYNDLRDQHGPFDVIGDVHGCRSELESLLTVLGYRLVRDDQGRPVDASHPEGRRAAFVGDLVDRGPDSAGVLRLVMGMHAAGHALCVQGNHEAKLVQALAGRKVRISHGLGETLAQLRAEGDDFCDRVRAWADQLRAHQVLDDGALVIAHAGLKEAYQGRASGRVRAFALYGDTTGETDEYGLPVRRAWAEDYRGRAMVLYGHTPTTKAQWVNNTLCLDTGCAFGGELTALRYPEKQLVSVPAEQQWYEPIRPLAPTALQRDPSELRLSDVLGNGGVETSLLGRISVRAENAAPALEVMGRFAMAPGWLPYLPPTMAPVDTSTEEDLLEHPEQAFDHYARLGIDSVICQEKHMGSRAVVLLCADAQAAQRFGRDGRTGSVVTRTGREFLPGRESEALLARLRTAVSASRLWQELDTDWLLLDCELMPWSLKARGLLIGQYAEVAAAGESALTAASDSLSRAARRGIAVEELAARIDARGQQLRSYRDAYRRYCWPTEGLKGVRLAPFQVLASRGHNWAERDHLWHLGRIDRLVGADSEFLTRTERLVLDPRDPGERDRAVLWWQDLTAAGGEGMVVKPLSNLQRDRKPIQPGLKVRGREYLRIIYGPDYTEPENLSRLKNRRLNRKRSLALREYALGMEGLDRLVTEEPLWRLHECVFGVLAMESEPVDPRL